MQESCHCSVCGWGWLAIAFGLCWHFHSGFMWCFPNGLVFTAAPWPGRSPVANEFNHNSGQTSLSALLSSAGSLLCCLVFFPWKSKNLGVEVYGKGRWALGIISIIHETSTFYMPVTSEAFRVEVAYLGILVHLTLDSLNLQHLPALGVLHHLSGTSFSSRERGMLNKT